MKRTRFAFAKKNFIAVSSAFFLITAGIILTASFFVLHPFQQPVNEEKTAVAPSAKIIPPCSGEDQFVIRRDGEVYYQTNGYCVIARDADPETFQILENGYAKDKNGGFYEGNRMEGSDGETFEALGWSWAKDKSRVYRWKYNATVERLAVKGADPATFVALDAWYGKDKDRGFYGWESISGSDGSTFVAIESKGSTQDRQDAWFAFAKDSRRVYFKDRVMEGAEPENFQLLKAFNEQYRSFSRDAKSIFVNDEAIVGAAPESFAFFVEMPGCGKYYRDDKSVFLETRIINGADPKSFQILGALHGLLYDKSCISRDADGVFSDTELAPSLDADSIVLLDGYAKDKNGVYFGPDLIPVVGAHRDSFVTTETSSLARDRESIYECGIRIMPNQTASQVLGDYYGRLGSVIYHAGQPMDGADAPTFRVLGGAGVISCEGSTGGYAVDSSSVYFAGKHVNGADPKTFELTGRIGYGKDAQAEYKLGVVVQNDFTNCSQDAESLPGGKAAWSKLVPQVNDSPSDVFLEFCFFSDGRILFGYKQQSDIETKTFRLYDSGQRLVGSANLDCSEEDGDVQPRSIGNLTGTRVQLFCGQYHACEGKSLYDLDLRKIAGSGDDAITTSQEYYDCGYRG